MSQPPGLNPCLIPAKIPREIRIIGQVNSHSGKSAPSRSARKTSPIAITNKPASTPPRFPPGLLSFLSSCIINYSPYYIDPKLRHSHPPPQPTQPTPPTTHTKKTKRNNKKK